MIRNMVKKDRRQIFPLMIAVAGSLATASCVRHESPGQPTQQTSDANAKAQCEALTANGDGDASARPYRIIDAVWRDEASAALPPHCEIVGAIQERQGKFGQDYAIRFHLRLPQAWNRRFLFQGGGGSNGNLGDALGATGIGNPTGLEQGFAVVSQDSGHSNDTNIDDTRNGNLVFGFDPIARRNYGYASLKLTYDAARDIIDSFYNTEPDFSYFYGCSKGGQEGMNFAQRYPDAFNGIVANAPAISLPRAAVAEAWDTQALYNVAGGTGSPSVKRLADAFSSDQFRLVGQAVLSACDADDGLADGIVSNFGTCTKEKVIPQLQARQCSSASSDGTSACLSTRQVAALVKIMDGARTSDGQLIYAPFPWDAGVGAPGWQFWKAGSNATNVIARNVVLGASSLAAVFTTPPVALGTDPDTLLKWMLQFDFDQDTKGIYRTGNGFDQSAWDDISARSTDLHAYRQNGGKLLIAQGLSDPVFSINDTLDWWTEVDRKQDGAASAFVRVFPVPGMNHCRGGPATDRFDLLTKLIEWVEHGDAPRQVTATAGPDTPWPGRTRPLCSYPLVAHYNGSGPIEEAGSFTCTVQDGAS